MEKVKKIGLVFASIVINIIAGGVIYYFWQPIASWYFNYRPVLGVDFYNLASHVGYLSRHFVWQFNGWKYIWWGGGPLSLDYPPFHAYFILPLLKWFSLPQAVQFYVVGLLFLFLFFSYLLFVEVGRDRVLALILALGMAFSLGVYGPLIWGGALQYVATLFFLPLTLWLLVKFFNHGDRRWFYLASLALGISIIAHPQIGFSYGVPIAFLLLLTYPMAGEKFLSFERLKRIFVYFSVVILVGYPQLGVHIGRSPLQILTTLPNEIIRILSQLFGVGKGYIPSSSVGQTVSPESLTGIAAFNRSQLQRFVTDTNQLFFFFLAVVAVVFILSFLFGKKRTSSLKVFIFALPALWVIFYNSLLAFGIAIQQGGWFRVFWPFPLALGILISFIWGDFWSGIKERLGALGQKLIFAILSPLISAVLILPVGFILLSQNSAQEMITQIETPGYRQQSSAFPDSLGVYIEKNEFENLKKRLTPSWLNPNETNYRFYDADQRVNIWWNALYDMPLVKGYIEFPPGDTFTGVFYWTSITLNQAGGESTLVKSWGFPQEMAYNNALFLIDWLSIKYIEAEHEKSDSYNPIASYLVENEVFDHKEKVIIPGWAQLYEVPNGQSIIWHPEEDEHLTYYGVKENLVSPITHPTNASVLGFIGREESYHTFLRDLAAVNLNSRKIIPVRLGRFIDEASFQSLKDMDALFLYSYDYKNHGKAWGRLEKYVKEGGRVFIETGSDVKQTNSVNLPAKYPKELPTIFPIKMTKQEKIGENWQLAGDSKETEGINLEDFGPPLIDDKSWLFSLPNSSSDLREGARVILSANDIPLIVAWKYGQGEVIWSGINLPYHIMTHKNLEEAKFFENLLEDLTKMPTVSYDNFAVDRPSANKMVVKGTGAKGVIFRENSNPGWTASLSSSGARKELQVYKTGPTYYGFSYVRIPQGVPGPFTVTFSYRGEFWVYFWTFVWFLTILTLLDRILLGSRFLVPTLRRIYHPISTKVSKWWEREEEE